MRIKNYNRILIFWSTIPLKSYVLKHPYDLTCTGWTQDSSGIMISWLHCTSHPVTHWRMQTTGRDDKHGGAGDHYRGTGGGSEHYGRAAGAGNHYKGPR